jgi:multicomponent Na+:H+ antiporter subunit A
VEDVYDGVLASLDAVSRAIAPALHSASLRIYVMVIVLTTVLIGGAVLATDPSLGSTLPRTSISIHDVLIVVVILAGASAATFARSTMSAVLALGAVGYGVAMVFLSFGAPDLAMTQFSVETLTVLIYVLVFRHFRGLGELSPVAVRVRDGLIAVASGLFIGGLLLSVATSGTAATSSTSSSWTFAPSTPSRRSRCWRPRPSGYGGCCDWRPTMGPPRDRSARSPRRSSARRRGC